MINKDAVTLKGEVSGNYLIYDADCPLCNSYISKVRLDKALGGIQFINAREATELVNELFMEGYDVNTGMILIINGHNYHGSDCMNQLALMTTFSSSFNSLNALLFKRPRLAKFIYPILVKGRNLTLRLLGRDKIAIAPAERE